MTRRLDETPFPPVSLWRDYTRRPGTAPESGYARSPQRFAFPKLRRLLEKNATISTTHCRNVGSNIWRDFQAFSRARRLDRREQASPA